MCVVMQWSVCYDALGYVCYMCNAVVCVLLVHMLQWYVFYIYNAVVCVLLIYCSGMSVTSVVVACVLLVHMLQRWQPVDDAGCSGPGSCF